MLCEHCDALTAAAAQRIARCGGMILFNTAPIFAGLKSTTTVNTRSVNQLIETPGFHSTALATQQTPIWALGMAAEELLLLLSKDLLEGFTLTACPGDIFADRSEGKTNNFSSIEEVKARRHLSAVADFSPTSCVVKVVSRTEEVQTSLMEPRSSQYLKGFGLYCRVFTLAYACMENVSLQNTDQTVLLSSHVMIALVMYTVCK